jgi:rod shape-determining protein MreD
VIRVWLPVLTFFFFVFDGTVMQVIFPEGTGTPYVLIPRFTTVLILFIAFFMTRPTALVYGLIFGFLTDIVYSDIIGVYFFSMAFTAYLMASISKIFRRNLLATFLLGLLGIVLLEFQVYGMYSIVGITRVSLNEFLYDRLFPSLVLNGLFIIVMYVPMKKLFAAIRAAKQRQSDQIGG